MTEFTVSVVLERLEQLSPGIEGLHVHGANLNIAKTFSYLLKHEWMVQLEIFLPAGEYQRTETMKLVAEDILPLWREGKGSLQFFPIHAMKDVWRDKRERVLLCLDPELLSRDRYLRDKFAIGPTIISCQTHGLGFPNLYQTMNRVAQAPRVEFDAVVCLSEACRLSLEETFESFLMTETKQPPFQLPVIGNPINCERLRPYSPEEKIRARKLLSLPEDATISLCLARLTPNSKADLMPMLNTFAEIAGPNDLLLLVGPENVPNYADQLLKRARELKLGRRFAIRTTVDHWAVPMVYGLADLYILPSDNVQETFCTTATEASAAGLPVLASDWDGIKDTVVHEETGYLIPTHMFPGLGDIEEFSSTTSYMSILLAIGQNTIVDVKEMKKYWAMLLASPELRATLGAAGRKRMVERFSPEQIYEQHRVLWSGLMEAARNEGEDEKLRRRAAADSIGLPVPYRRLFASYGAGVLDPTQVKVKLGPVGLKAANGKEAIQFYDETLPMLRPELVNCLLDLLADHQGSEETLSFFAGRAAEMTRLSEDQALFHLGLLVKRGLIEYSVAS